MRGPLFFNKIGKKIIAMQHLEKDVEVEITKRYPSILWNATNCHTCLANQQKPLILYMQGRNGQDINRKTQAWRNGNVFGFL